MPSPKELPDKREGELTLSSRPRTLLSRDWERSHAGGNDAPYIYQVYEKDGPGGSHRRISIPDVASYAHYRRPSVPSPVEEYGRRSRLHMKIEDRYSL
ncbi:hypothetical protein LIER_00985 [Lithospermum erythrorhizon]|uniref:Uncharacterized protein n=1 Tax=Lithospermum erythrorhizon TaxID=34254 RepID=A0AAV3NLR7_LITER